MVACSLLDDATAERLAGSATGVLTGAGREGGSGFGLRDALPVWLGFHIALKTADIRAVDFCINRQRFLREPFCDAQPPQIQRNELSGVHFRTRPA